jgi:hypothetical protein
MVTTVGQVINLTGNQVAVGSRRMAELNGKWRDFLERKDGQQNAM